MPPGPARKADVQKPRGLCTYHLDGRLLHILLDIPVLLLGHAGYHLQFKVRVPGRYARGNGGLYALFAAGIRHHHALYVLDDVPRDPGLYALGCRPQHLPQPCRAVGQGDGLRAAGGGDQLLPEDGYVRVSDLLSDHGFSLPCALLIGFDELNIVYLRVRQHRAVKVLRRDIPVIPGLGLEIASDIRVVEHSAVPGVYLVAGHGQLP